MVTNVLGGAVETLAPAQNVRSSQPVFSGAGVNDLGALARQQLASAAPAPSLIAAYTSTIVPQTPKLVSRPVTNAASSPLAAQFIAQDSALTQDELAIFTPRSAAPPAADTQPAGDDYLSGLRIARGDFSAAQKTAPTQTGTRPTQETVAQTTTTAANNAAAQAPMLQGSAAQTSAALPALLSQFFRAPGISNTRGTLAYQLAQTRNAAIRPQPEPVA